MPFSHATAAPWVPYAPSFNGKYPHGAHRWHGLGIRLWRCCAERPGHRHWGRAWRAAEPKHAYDVVIIGGGGHGLAAAHYLAAVHGVTRVAVVEKGWIGGGDTAHKATVVFSNYA